MAARVIVSQRGGEIYVDDDDFVYHVRKRGERSVSVRCAQYQRSHCQVRATIRLPNLQIVLRGGEHNHAAEHVRIDTQPMIDAIKRRVVAEQTSLLRIFNQESIR